MTNKHIGISEDRLKHIIGVARKAYDLAKLRGHDETYARKCFLMGWLHDVGYEFSAQQNQHPQIGAELISLFMPIDDNNENFFNAIKQHGQYPSKLTEEYLILNQADMLINHDGREVDVMTRLNDIRERYGDYSDQYLTACDICYRIGLTATNLAKNI